MKNVFTLNSIKTAAIFCLLGCWISLTFSLSLVEITFVCSLVFWIVSRILTRPLLSKQYDKATWWPLAAFFVLVVVSYFFSEFPEKSFRGIFKIAEQLLLFVMVADLFRSEKVRKKFEIVFLLVFLVIVFNSIVQYSFGRDFLRGFPPVASGAGLRISAAFGQYGKMAAYLIIVLPLVLAIAIKKYRSKETGIRPVFVVLLFLSGILLLFLTRSRGAILAFLLGSIITFALMRKFKILFMIAIVFSALFFVLPREMIIHLDSDLKEQSLVERKVLWERAWQVISAKPIIGTGINTYTLSHKKYDKINNWRVKNYYAHNGYLQLAAETGLPCIFFFFLFLFQFFRRGLRMVKRVRGDPDEAIHWGMLAGSLCFLIFVVGDTALQSTQPVMTFWFVAGLLLAYQNDFVRSMRN